jgi:hypothetical protein
MELRSSGGKTVVVHNQVALRGTIPLCVERVKPPGEAAPAPSRSAP